MKFREIFRFEFMYQARRVRTWLYFAVLFVVAYLLIS
jgi:ABC-2 type transport system permease protein